MAFIKVIKGNDLVPISERYTKTLDWALSQNQLKAKEKIVLIALAFGSDGIECEASLKDIAETCGLSKNGVLSSLDTLYFMELVDKKHVFCDVTGGRLANKYILKGE